MQNSRLASLRSYETMNIILNTNDQQGNGALWLGDYTAANDLMNLKKQGIKTVLCVAQELNIRYPQGSGIFQKVYNILDIPSADIQKLFNDTYEQISQGLKIGGVLVHCAAGVSRSSSTVIAYLMRERQMSFMEAYNFVKDKRSVIYPNQGFQRQLKQFEQQLMQTKINQPDIFFKGDQPLMKQNDNTNTKQLQVAEYDKIKSQSQFYSMKINELSANNSNDKASFEFRKNSIQQPSMVSKIAIKRPESVKLTNNQRPAEGTKIISKNVIEEKLQVDKLFSKTKNFVMPYSHQSTYASSYGSFYKPKILTYNQSDQIQGDKKDKALVPQNMVTCSQNPYVFKN